MEEVILRYGDVGRGTSEERPKSVADLLRRLEEIGNEYRARLGMPYSVDLVRKGIGRLSVGLGNGEWIICYFPEGDEEPLYSFGDASQLGTVVFYFGADTRMSKKYLVPRSDAIDVVRQWYEHGTLSAAICWTDEVF
jgi:hypothetical protein